MKRLFIIVLDSFGIGEMPDAAEWNDCGSNTLGAVRCNKIFSCPELERLGLFDIDGIGGGTEFPKASFARMSEASRGKDTTVGHWEIAGIISEKPFPVYPDGFPTEIIEEFESRTGRKTLCNLPYSGTEVIKEYGEEHIKTGKLIVYTSGDSVFQIAAHEDVVSLDELYSYCRVARNMLSGEHAVGRVIARPFAGKYPFYRTSGRHDFSLEPPRQTLLDVLKANAKQTIAVGKINDIFAGRGISESVATKNNEEGMSAALKIQKRDFEGLCFINLVDFDTLYGHRNDADGYAAALTEFDKELGVFLKNMRTDDVLIITADHGCDPSTPSTDHSREYTPMLIYGDKIKRGINLGTRDSFSDIAATVLDYFEIKDGNLSGKSFWKEVFHE